MPQELALRVTAPELRHVTVRTGKDVAVATIQPDEDRVARRSRSTAKPFDVINNAGSALYPGGYGGDRGFLERDAGQYDEPAEVFAWCGGAVLLSKAYLDDVGLFDERLFLYYEDTDLSWRGRLRGWRYVYEPTSRRPSPPRRVVRRSGSRGLPLLHGAQPGRSCSPRTPRPGWRSARGPGVVKRAVRVERPRPAGAATHACVGRRRRRTRTAAVGPRRATSAGCRRCCATGGVRRQVVGRRSLLAWTITKETAGMTRRRVAVYDLYWSTMGGGEQVAGTIAEALSARPRRHPARSRARRRRAAPRAARRRRHGLLASTPSHDDVDASAASAEYDVFVNSTYRSAAVNRSPLGWYYVHFPEPRLTPRERARHLLGLDRASRRCRSHLGCPGTLATLRRPLRTSSPTDRVRPELPPRVPRQLRVHGATGSSDCGDVRPRCSTRPCGRRSVPASRGRRSSTSGGSSTPARATPRSSSS